MKMVIMAIRDRQLNGFMQPFFAQTIGTGLRAFTDLVNNADSEPFKHAEDYELYHIGEYDDAKGLVTATTDVNGEPQPQQIALATNVLRQRN